MEKLHRDNLTELVNKRIEMKKNDITKEEYNDFFTYLENILNSYLYEVDPRFVIYGRRNFLHQEYNSFLNNNNYLDALKNLEEYICDYTSFLTPADVPEYETRNFHDILKANDDYFKDGIICLQEKNIIIEMINEFRKHI